MVLQNNICVTDRLFFVWIQDVRGRAMPDNIKISISYVAIGNEPAGMLDEEPIYRRVRQGKLVIERYDGTRVPTGSEIDIEYFAS